MIVAMLAPLRSPVGTRALTVRPAGLDDLAFVPLQTLRAKVIPAASGARWDSSSGVLPITCRGGDGRTIPRNARLTIWNCRPVSFKRQELCGRLSMMARKPRLAVTQRQPRVARGASCSKHNSDQLLGYRAARKVSRPSGRPDVPGVAHCEKGDVQLGARPAKRIKRAPGLRGDVWWLA